MSLGDRAETRDCQVCSSKRSRPLLRPDAVLPGSAKSKGPRI